MFLDSAFQIFGGNALQYISFIKAFEQLIETRTSSNTSRMYYLAQYTSGEVKELVRSYLTRSDDSAYLEAKDAPKKRYGQNYRIATAYVDEITKGPAFRSEDRNGLKKFSIKLTSCGNALKAVGYLNKIENPDSLRKVVNRLPYDLRKRWRSIADTINEKQQRDVNFGDIAEFDHKYADKKGKTFITRQSEEIVGPSSETTVNLPPATKKPLRCPHCSNEHLLVNCSGFSRFTYEEKVKFVRDKALCFNCFLPRHRSRECWKPRSKCNICNGAHHSSLHNPEKVKNGSITKTSQKEKISMPIVPVLVRAFENGELQLVYALLDTGSTATFCTTQLMNKLNANTRKTTIS
ncbi:uncharacterized protein LOC141907782 [Tubulanus polymorphus]|uniref:uncharacterized protein LOC141907782 n=1 Tax=Tubulanus polymorphus TaxID=672921 RepID=UPI003DA5FE75